MIEISVDNGPEEKLGITLRDLPGVGVVLSKVTDTGAARRCGNVEQGQKIIFINDVDMEGKTKPDMMPILKAHDYSQPLKLTLAPPASYLSKLAGPSAEPDKVAADTSAKPEAEENPAAVEPTAAATEPAVEPAAIEPAAVEPATAATFFIKGRNHVGSPDKAPCCVARAQVATQWSAGDVCEALFAEDGE